MIHIRIDNGEIENSKAQFVCGLGPGMVNWIAGDIYYWEGEAQRAGFRDEPVCPGCFPNGKPQIGTPISQLSGRPGEPGFSEFCRISQSWGYD